MDSRGKIQTSGSLSSMTNIWSNAYRHSVTSVLHPPAQVCTMRMLCMMLGALSWGGQACSLYLITPATKMRAIIFQ